MSVVDEVKQRTDIVEVIGQYTKLTKAGKTFRALCPFHSETHPSFFVYPEQQSWHCFGACNTGGDVFSFLMKKDNLDFGEALRQLADRAGIVIPSRQEPEAGKDERERLYQINKTAAEYFQETLDNSAATKARDYLTSRGLSAETVSEFQLGFSLNNWEDLKEQLSKIGYTEEELLQAGLIIAAEDGKTHDRFRNRLMFPITDIRGRVTGFGARALDDTPPKYLNSPQTPVFDKSNTLYGINLAAPAIRQQELAVIVEGYMDVITAHQNGLHNVIASMGTAITDRQVNTIKRLTRNVALAMDADAAGEEAMLRCVGYENTLNAEMKVIIMPAGKDPDDVIREDPASWQRLLKEAVPIVDYTFDVVSAGLDLSTARDQSALVYRLGPIINEINDPIRQAHYKQKLARLARVDVKTVETALGGIRTGQNRYRSRESKPVGPTHPSRPLFSRPKEDYCLALLLQHPELKNNGLAIAAEYYDNIENREIFTTWQQTGEPSSLKEKLDIVLHDHLDQLLNKNLPSTSTPLENILNDCILALEEAFLRRQEIEKEATLASVAEQGGTEAELIKLHEEQGTDTSIQLGKIFNQRARRSQSLRR